MGNTSRFSHDIIFVLLSCVFIVIAILGISTIPQSEISTSQSEIQSEKSKYLSDPKGYPDKFQEYFRAIEGLDQGYQPYPQGYRITEFQNALLRNEKNGRAPVQLAWVERGPGNNGGRSRAVVVDPGDPKLNTWFVASVGGGVWRGELSTSQFGLQSMKWTPLTDHLPTLAATTLAMSASNPDVMYVGTGEGFFNVNASAGTGIFRSNDRGQSWVQLPGTVNPQTDDWRFVNRLVVHPDNSEIVVAVTNAGIFRTENGGQSFTKVHDSDERVQDLKVHPSNFDIQFAAVHESEILRSTDGGKTWETVFDFFRYSPGRIELAISRSNPDVIWASVDGADDNRSIQLLLPPIRLPISDLYRSVDGGETWRFIEHSGDEVPLERAFLGPQGWYNNSLLVHPFSPDSIFIGGVWMSRAWVTPQSESIEDSIGTVTDFSSTVNFMDFVPFGGVVAQGRLDLGYLLEEESGVQDVTLKDVVSVEIRFGPGRSQKAHRFTIPPEAGTQRDGGAGVFLIEYIYEDYVEVPFEVWDTDNDRQLMISFRDQAADGNWSLTPLNTRGPRNTQSREYVIISKYDYDDTNPHPNLMIDGGVRTGNMYMFWPVLSVSGPGWNPNSPSEGIIDIDFRKGLQDRETGVVSYWSSPNDNADIHVDHHAIIAVPTEQRNFHILNANDGGFAYSLDGGEKWSEGDRSSGFNTSQFYDATKQPGLARYLGGTQDNSTWISNFNPNSQSNWMEILSGDGFDVVWKSADSLMGTSQGNVISRSVDGGKNWEPAGNIDDWNGQFLTTLGWTPETGEAVFSYSPEGGPLRSLDFGNSWHQLYSDWSPLSGGSGGKIRVSLADPSVVWSGDRMLSSGVPGNLHVTQDALNSLSKVRTREVNRPAGTPAALISGLATHPFTLATAYVMFSVWCQPKLFRTEDLGESWEQLSGFPEDRPPGSTAPCPGSSNGFPNAKVYDLEVFEQIPWVMWAATDFGIYESRDHGETWAYADNGLPAVSVWRIRIVDDEIIVATHGRGVWTLPINQVQTHAQQDGLELPASFELIGNYPNPFNPTTNIQFRVANASHIRVDVFDVLGRKVATLTDQPYESGSHQIQWNASSISSGQYIYRMEADGKIIGAKSMVLIK